MFLTLIYVFRSAGDLTTGDFALRNGMDYEYSSSQVSKFCHILLFLTSLYSYLFS